MISAANQLLLQQAIERVQQKRATQQQQTAAAAQAAVTAKVAPGAKSKSGAKSQTKTAAAKTPASKSTAEAGVATTAQPGSSGITPYLEADDLMAVADRNQVDDTSVADTNYEAEATYANALRSAGDIERGRGKNVSAANDDAAARGLYDSGIRAGNVGMANADAARAQTDLLGATGAAKARQLATLGRIEQGRAQFSQAMIQKAAENGMALPVDPYDGAGAPNGTSPTRVKAAQNQRKAPGQNGAANVRGAATLKKAKSTKSKMKLVRR